MPDDPIYRDLADELLVDVAPQPGEQPALAMLGPVRYGRDADYPLPRGLDAQSIAYRGMTADDVVTDDELGALAVRIHPPYVPGADVPPATVEEYEQVVWDRDRVDTREDR